MFNFISRPIPATDVSAVAVSDAHEPWESKRKPFTAEFIELDPSDVRRPPCFLIHIRQLTGRKSSELTIKLIVVDLLPGWLRSSDAGKGHPSGCRLLYAALAGKLVVL
jgi:hypothetical protein